MIRVATWNLELAAAGSDRMAAIQRRLDAVAGDFNLTVPGTGLSNDLVAALEESGLTVVTAGDYDILKGERKLMDHIAVTRKTLPCSDLQVWPRRDPSYREGKSEVTDHAGCAVTLG